MNSSDARHPLVNHEFRHLWIGETVSQFGSMISQLRWRPSRYGFGLISIAKPGFDHAHDLECLECLSQRCAADAELVAKFSLGRNLFALAPYSADEMAYHFAADVGGKGGPYNGRETLCLHVLFHSSVKPPQA